MAAKIAKADVKTILDIVVQQNQLFWCEHCDIYFPTYSTFILHKGCHSNEEQFQCHFCGTVFFDKHEFLAHFMQCAHD
ncbi:hypothetical protein CAPTEDRAFT_105803 [Capitella teleta]|uniref:C2H2-type domain-containing protein n=1 Tax=Capitella teleta TaxID=283909 RepID=R7V182_CAPTE|nr:hypothetical protein CAPTEDRAFT_105803 [Capitella teleta]|eukprot:ELU09972.1 hypothetical protein CAPTEDRAFT_105803 [Capitella teleta]